MLEKTEINRRNEVKQNNIRKQRRYMEEDIGYLTMFYINATNN